MTLPTSSAEFDPDLYALREAVDADGTLLLELHAEGSFIACARARSDLVLEASSSVTGPSVREQLTAALEGRLKREHARVDLGTPESTSDGRFLSRYLYRAEGGDITAGRVWYDETSKSTGPEEVPAIVRSRMRLAVTRKPTESQRSLLTVLREALNGMSS